MDMDSQHKVLFYGNSLVLCGIQAILKASPGFEVIAFDRTVNQKELLAADPSVVIFDLGAFESEFLVAQTQALPNLLLIGVDSECHEVLLTGQAASSITLDQITQIVQSWVRPGVDRPVSPAAKSKSPSVPTC
jgi:hypothetical protein